MDFYVLFCNTLIYFRVQATHLTNCTCITVSVQSVKFRQQIKEHSDTKLIPLHFAKAHEYIQCVSYVQAGATHHYTASASAS